MTELVTGIDLVQWQLRIARGERARRHAGAAGRTPSRCGCTPRTRARSCRRRAGSSGCGCPSSVRVEAGVAEGDEVGTSYDPMIAKLIAAGTTRDGGARPARGGARRDRGRGRDDEPPLPPLARRASRVARGRDDDRVPRRPSAAVGSACGRSRRGVARAVPAQPAPGAGSRPPPDVDTAAGDHDAHRGGASTVTAPMPGTVIRSTSPQARRSRPASRSSSSRR